MKFENKELKTRVVSCVACAMIAMFLGAGALASMLATREFLICGILMLIFISPIVIWRIIYSIADKNIHKRIAKSADAIKFIVKVEYNRYYKKSKRGNRGKEVYMTSVLTGEDCGDNIPNRLYISTDKYDRGDFVEIKFIKEQYQYCLILRRANYDEYKAQFSYPPEYWNDYNGDGSNLLFDDDLHDEMDDGIEDEIQNNQDDENKN